MEIRLQKILADLGVASRRKSEAIIEEGRVTVNGTVAEIGQKADPELDHIKLDGKLLTRRPGPKVYYAFHKPRGVVSTLEDPQERPNVGDYLRRIKARVYPIGRLDFDSEGLLLLTNDGEFTQAVLHPSKKTPKVYQVKVKGVLSDEDIAAIEKGIYLEDGKTAPAKVKKLRKTRENSWIELTIHEGKKRQIRRMLFRVGHSVVRLVRVKVSGIEITGLAPGEMRPLTKNELDMLRSKMTAGGPAPAKRKRRAHV
jgi:23S rRNA pseudouridine2605 synthase